MEGRQLRWFGLIRLRAMVFVLVVSLNGYIGETEEGDKFSNRHKTLEVDRKLRQLRKPAVKTIQSEDGDIIDCIDIYKQLALDHPALKNHTIQMAPSYDPTKETESKMTKFERLERKRNQQASMLVTQPWKKNGSCPDGTIPVRRVRKQDLLRAASVEAYGRKQRTSSQPHVLHDANKTVFVEQANHSKAVVLTVGYRYNGAKGNIRVCTPNVEFDDDYTTSHLSLSNGPYHTYEIIQSGWTVNPGVYGDRQTRFMVYWTVQGDASKETGCFDLTCPGFVQTSKDIVLGAAIYPISIPGGLPYEIIVYIFKDKETNNWWVQYGEYRDRIFIGYWPAELFKGGLQIHAEAVEWGGEVFSARVGTTPHTKTGMGCGVMPDYSWTSGFIKRMRIHDNSAELKFPEWTETSVDEYLCYDIDYVSDYIEDPEFYFGGPGQNERCP